MTSILSLWLPIIVSAVFVFIASSIIHMFLPYHRSDFVKVPDEDNLMDDLRKYNIPAGNYALPCAGDPKTMNSPEFKEKLNTGPVAFITFIKPGTPKMAASLAQWFIYLLVVGVLAAYVTSRAVGPEAHYLTVFRFAGATSFIAYAVALWQNTIWYKISWKVSLKNTFDGLIYALITAGVFGWLWNF